MLLPVSHGLLLQPTQGKKPQSFTSQRAQVPLRLGKPHLCEEGPGRSDGWTYDAAEETPAVHAAEEMTAMEYVTFFGYIGGFLAFFYAIGAATKLFT